jgi:deoxyribodipyrimidine photolyase
MAQNDAYHLSVVAPQALSGKKGFISNMKGFHDQRNDPNANKVSNMSPYLHFGQISAQQMAVEIAKHKGKFRVSIPACDLRLEIHTKSRLVAGVLCSTLACMCT